MVTQRKMKKYLEIRRAVLFAESYANQAFGHVERKHLDRQMVEWRKTATPLMKASLPTLLAVRGIYRMGDSFVWTYRD